MKILIVGATGMLGHTLARYFNGNPIYNVGLVVRSKNLLINAGINSQNNIFEISDLEVGSEVSKIINSWKPKVVINCIGVIKQSSKIDDLKETIYINSILPHKLLMECEKNNAKLISFSTDCVFSGKKGNYNEKDKPDADDLYGLTKSLGEALGEKSVCIRTSIIGPELSSSRSLLEWFLNAGERVTGFKNAIFSGFPTYEIAKILDKYVIHNSNIHGLYHLSSEPISKYDLLCLINEIYCLGKVIEPDYSFIIDRSLDSSEFKNLTGYCAPKWNDLVTEMRRFG